MAEALSPKITKVSELKQGKAIGTLQDAFLDYATEAFSAADFPNMSDFVVMYNDKKPNSAIILIAEGHDSTHKKMYPLAKACAQAALAIPGVKIAVEEPLIDKASKRLFSNAGTRADKIAECIKSKVSIFDEAKGIPGNAASIIHQLFDLSKDDSHRFPAEPFENTAIKRQTAKINNDMAAKLNANTANSDITVFPVGHYHFKKSYVDPTVVDALTKLGYTTLSNA